MLITVLVQLTTIPPWLQFLWLNLFLLSFYSHVITGLSLAWFYFQKKNVPMFLRVLLLFMLLTMQVVLLALIFVTIADGVFDFRRLKASQAEVVQEDEED